MPQVLPMTRVEAYLAYKAGVIQESELKPTLKTNFYTGLEHWLAFWCGLCDDYPVDENNNPKWYNEEEYYVAYLCGIAQDYPTNCYRRVGAYLRHIISYRWPEPEKPLTREEYYLSLINSTTTSNPTPSSIFTLNDTTDGTFQGVEVYGDTTQNGEPTPDAPVDVNVVTGEQTVAVTGKNLFDKSDPALVFNGYLAAGTITLANNPSDRTVFIPCQPNTEYTIQKMFSSSSKNRFRIASFATLPTNGAVGTNLGGYSQGDADTHNTATYTTSADAKYLVVFCYTNDTNVSFSQMLDSIQIELGSTASDYVPYQGHSYPISLGSLELAKIGDYQDYIRKSTGKNLLSFADGTGTNLGVKVVASNGKLTITRESSNANNAFIRFDLVKPLTFQAGDTVTLSANNVDTIGTNTNYLSIRLYAGADITQTDVKLNVANAHTTYTFAAETTITKLTVRCASSLSPQGIIALPQLELGSTATDYEPYGEIWYKHETISKTTFDGSDDESWAIANTGTENWYYRVTGPIVPPGKDTLQVKCSQSVAAHVTNSNTTVGCWVLAAGQFRMRTSAAEDTIPNWRTHLSNTPMQVYCIRGSALDTEITDAALVAQLEALAAGQSYDPLTNFIVTATDPNLPALLKITAYKKQ